MDCKLRSKHIDRARWKSLAALCLWFLVVCLSSPLVAQTTSSPAPAKPLDELGLTVQDLSTQPEPAAGQASAAKQEHTITPDEAKTFLASIDEILKFASQDTALPIKEEVKRKFVSRDEVQAYVQANMKEDRDAKRLERSETVLKKFGLLPRDFELKTFLVRLLREQVAGYYDPKKKTVNLLNWVDPEQQRPVMAHELTHALQDQSFQLEKWMKEGLEADAKEEVPRPSDVESDEVLSARQAIIEGQAMAVLLDYSLAPTGRTLLETPQIVEALKQGMLGGGPDTPTFSDAPIFIKETLTFSYRYGLDFTVALLASGGKELAFAGALKVPPRTTREIMEPDTYLQHEKLPAMKMLDFEKDFKDYETFDIGAIGEFDVDVLAQQYAGHDAGIALYPEWRGGYYYAGRPKKDKSGPLGLIYVSRWSTPAAAAQFAGVYAKSLAKRYKKSQALGSDGKPITDAPPVESWRTIRGRHAWLTEEGPVVIDVRGDSILVSESMDEPTIKRAADDFWGKAK